MTSKETYLAIGMMSGTSVDGLDAVLIETDGQNNTRHIDSAYERYPDDFRKRLRQAAKEDIPLLDLLRLEKDFTAQHVALIEKLLQQASREAKDIDVIGMHGQTLRHLPEEGLTLQMGNASQLAELTGIAVVNDLRRRDMAAGGQGAPVVPLYHRALFANEEKPFAVLNLGGVANVTYVGVDPDTDEEIILSGDTGPGMTLLDRWIYEKTGKPMDENGDISRRGRVDINVVEGAMKQEFFNKPLPRSADIHDFDTIDVSRLSLEDGAATLCAVTVAAVARVVNSLPQLPKALWVTGGGTWHPVVMEMLAEKIPTVRHVDEAGLNPDTIEAECFAWLAVRRLLGKPTTIPSTTGAEKATCGGVLAA